MVNSILETVGVICGLGGAAAMAYQRLRLASCLWIISNGALIAVMIDADKPALVLMYLAYGALAVISLINLRRKKRGHHAKEWTLPGVRGAVEERANGAYVRAALNPVPGPSRSE